MRALFEPISAAPPWGWNPIGTAVEAFNDTRRTMLAQQAEARLQEAQAIENAVARETLPYAAKKAQLEVENLRADIGYRTALADRQRAEAASLNEERLGALDAGSSVEGILGNELYGRVFRRAPASSSTTSSAPKPAAIGIDELPAVAEEPQQNFNLDSGAPLRLNSSTGNTLIDTFGQARKPNPLDSFDARMVDYNSGPPPGQELAPIGSTGGVIESNKTSTPEERDAVLESAARQIQTRGGSSPANPLAEFNPAPEPREEQPNTSSLGALLDDYRQAGTVLKSQQFAARDRRELGRLKGAVELVDQQFMNNAAADFGMGATEFAILSRMDPTIVGKVEEHYRKSGGRDGWAGSIDYVTALSKKQADLQVAQDLGLAKTESADPQKAFELASSQAELAEKQAVALEARGEFTRAKMLRDNATAKLLDITGLAPQISDQEVALGAYQTMKTAADQTQRVNAQTELLNIIPRLAQNGFAVSLDGLTDADAEEEIRDAVRSYPNSYNQMFVVKGGAAKPLAEAFAELQSADTAANAPADSRKTDSAGLGKAKETPTPFDNEEDTSMQTRLARTLFNKDEQAKTNRAAQKRSLERDLAAFKKQRDNVKNDSWSSTEGKQREFRKYDAKVKEIEAALRSL